MILIIEDDEFLRDILVTKLKSSGYKSEIAADGREALRKIRELKPTLVLLDLVMPSMDGFEVLKSINKDKELAGVSVVVLSNLGHEDDIERAKHLGAKDYLVKAHYTPTELVEKIKQYI